MRENTSGYKPATLDIHDTKNQVLAKKVNFGNGARQALEVINVSELKKLEFRRDCQKMLIKVCDKLQERFPMKYSFLRGLKCMNPSEMVSNNCRSPFQTVTRKLVSAKIRTPQECDATEQQFCRFFRD